MSKHEQRDVVIVGAGAAGSYLARHLAEAGKSVVVLEAGPAWHMGDLISSQIWARRLRWGGVPVETTGEHPFGYGFNAGWGLGGAALHHYGTWPRMHEEDFRMHSRYGRGLDWPLDYETLAPHYDAVQSEVGISGDAEAEIWRPSGAPYPLPPLRTFGQAHVLARGFEKLGMHTAPMPMAILSRNYKGRAACIYDGWCDAGCPITALYNPLVNDIPGARQAGAEFRVHANVTRVLTDGRKRARGVEYLDGEGERHVQSADVVILAASAVHNPALLLNSANDAWPDGVANTNGLVGRYFMTHSMATVYGLFKEETEPHLGVTGAQLTCRDGYRKDSREAGFGSYQWLIAPAAKPNDLLGVAMARADLYGRRLDDFLARASHHFAGMFGMGEDLPQAENRVELGTARDERSGMRQPRIVHRFDSDGLAVWKHAQDEGLRVVKAAGAQESWNAVRGTAHMMGGTIMGNDPKASVTDAFGRAHDLPNLVLAGTGLFPTSAAVNPTFTLYALARRTALDMVEHWQNYTA